MELRLPKYLCPVQAPQGFGPLSLERCCHHDTSEMLFDSARYFFIRSERENCPGHLKLEDNEVCREKQCQIPQLQSLPRSACSGTPTFGSKLSLNLTYHKGADETAQSKVSPSAVVTFILTSFIKYVYFWGCISVGHL